ncbi:hypothetical protein D3C72_1715160 [compost metagenome]
MVAQLDPLQRLLFGQQVVRRHNGHNLLLRNQLRLQRLGSREAQPQADIDLSTFNGSGQQIVPHIGPLEHGHGTGSLPLNDGSSRQLRGSGHIRDAQHILASLQHLLDTLNSQEIIAQHPFHLRANGLAGRRQLHRACTPVK